MDLPAYRERAEMLRHARMRRWPIDSQAACSVAVSLVLQMECQPVGVQSVHMCMVDGAPQARR